MLFRSAVGMGVLAGPIMRLIFGDNSALARNLLTLGAPAVIFFSLSTVTNAVLQGIDLMRKSVTHSAISLALHVILVYVLLQHFNMGVYGLVIGNVTFALAVCILNWLAIGKALKYRRKSKPPSCCPWFPLLLWGPSPWLFTGWLLPSQDTISWVFW